MKVKILRTVYTAPPWVMPRPTLEIGTVVPVVPATNIPQDSPTAIRYWVDLPEMRDDPYGTGLCDGDFEKVTP